MKSDMTYNICTISYFSLLRLQLNYNILNISYGFFGFCLIKLHLKRDPFTESKFNILLYFLKFLFALT